MAAITDHLPLDNDEIARMLAILQRERGWIRSVNYPSPGPGGILVETRDQATWVITRPRDLVRLKFRYCRFHA